MNAQHLLSDRKTSTVISSVLWAESLDLPRKSVTDSFFFKFQQLNIKYRTGCVIMMKMFPWPIHVNSTVTTTFSKGQEYFTIGCLSIARYGGKSWKRNKKKLKLWTYGSLKRKKKMFQVCIYNLILSWSLLAPSGLNGIILLILAI